MTEHRDDPLGGARAIVHGLGIMLPLWAGLALAVRRLVGG